jgi:serine/threonine-protein phosphatase 2B regulatory subunit
LFDRDYEERINFRSFVSGLSLFSENTRPEVKCRAVFKLFDADGDGVLSRDDLRQLATLMVGRTVSPSALDALVEKTMVEADRDGDGQISFGDFEQSLGAVAWSFLSVPVKASATLKWDDAGRNSPAPNRAPGHPNN